MRQFIDLFSSTNKVSKKKTFSRIKASTEKWVRAQSLKPDYLSLYLTFTTYFLCNFKHGIIPVSQFSHLCNGIIVFRKHLKQCLA